MSLTRIEIDIRPEANERDHWAAKAKRTASHRRATLAIHWQDIADARALLAAGTRLVVRLTRIAPRMLDDDNLAGGFKAMRDGIAQRLEIDDRDPRVDWRYAQESGTHARERAALVSITPNGDGDGIARAPSRPSH